MTLGVLAAIGGALTAAYFLRLLRQVTHGAGVARGRRAGAAGRRSRHGVGRLGAAGACWRWLVGLVPALVLGLSAAPVARPDRGGDAVTQTSTTSRCCRPTWPRGTAVLVLLADLFVARPAVTLAVAAGSARWRPRWPRSSSVPAATASTFCAAGRLLLRLADGRSALVAAVFAAADARRARRCRCPLLRAGGRAGRGVLLPAGLLDDRRRGARRGRRPDHPDRRAGDADPAAVRAGRPAPRSTVRRAPTAAVTFFVVSVVATAVTLLGAALLYAATGAPAPASAAGAAAGGDPAALACRWPRSASRCSWSASRSRSPRCRCTPGRRATYDGAPLPVAAYLSTASKLGGVVALLAVVTIALPAAADRARSWPSLAVLTMTVGNLVALRQTPDGPAAGLVVGGAGRLHPGAAGRAGPGRRAHRGRLRHGGDGRRGVRGLLRGARARRVRRGGRAARADADGGATSTDYRGAARRHRWVGAALALALAGLAGLPPGLAGLFAKVAVVRSLLTGASGWLAVVVALNAVIGLAYYVARRRPCSRSARPARAR